MLRSAQAVEAAARQGDYATLLSARWALFTGSFPRTWRDAPAGHEPHPVHPRPAGSAARCARRAQAPRPAHRRVDDLRRARVGSCLGWCFATCRRCPCPAPIGRSSTGLGLVQDQWLCFTYIGAVVLLLAYRPVWTARLALFGQAGRMALTNYMVQAAVLDVLASGYGLGLKLRPCVVCRWRAVLLFAAEAGVEPRVAGALPVRAARVALARAHLCSTSADSAGRRPRRPRDLAPRLHLSQCSEGSECRIKE